MSVPQIPRNPYHVISRETELLHQIRDIRDELRMLRSLAEQQEVVWKQAFETEELKDCFYYHHPCTPTDIKGDLDKMIMEAEVANESVSFYHGGNI